MPKADNDDYNDNGDFVDEPVTKASTSATTTTRRSEPEPQYESKTSYRDEPEPEPKPEPAKSRPDSARSNKSNKKRAGDDDLDFLDQFDDDDYNY